MKNAQAKIDALIDCLVERCIAGIGSLGAASWITPAELKGELEWLIKMSNMNNVRQEKVGKEPGPQAKVASEITNAELVSQLIAGRDPDQFPRRGPRKGKRENVSTPLKDIPDVVTCAVHEGVVCLPSGEKGPGAVEFRCPDCAKEVETAGQFLSLKALL